MLSCHYQVAALGVAVHWVFDFQRLHFLMTKPAALPKERQTAVMTSAAVPQ